MDSGREGLESLLFYFDEGLVFKKGELVDRLSVEAVWLDRLAGGLLSQYLRRAAPQTRGQKSVLWMSGTSLKFKTIFIIPQNLNFDLQKFKKKWNNLDSFRCECVGDIPEDIEKQFKKLFKEYQKIERPQAWSEDFSSRESKTLEQ